MCNAACCSVCVLLMRQGDDTLMSTDGSNFRGKASIAGHLAAKVRPRCEAWAMVALRGTHVLSEASRRGAAVPRPFSRSFKCVAVCRRPDWAALLSTRRASQYDDGRHHGVCDGRAGAGGWSKCARCVVRNPLAVSCATLRCDACACHVRCLQRCNFQAAFMLFPTAAGGLYVRNEIFRCGPGAAPLNDAAGGELAKTFVGRFFEIFDSDRSGLAAIYVRYLRCALCLADCRVQAEIWCCVCHRHRRALCVCDAATDVLCAV